MFRGVRFFPKDSNINFVGARFIAYIFSAVLVLGSIGLTVQNGLNLGIDFTGGTAIEIRTPSEPKLQDLRVSLNGLGIGAVSIQEFGKPDDLLIRFSEQPKPQGWTEADEEPNKVAVEKVRKVLDAAFEGQAVDYRRIEFVGPQVGSELKLKGLYAVVFSLLGMMIYIWFRFEWQFGLAAILALAHDTIITIGFFALTQMEFNLSTVAAILMIGGYSINDTVVVFDRIRENLRKFKKKPLAEVLNLSINGTLSRTTMTSFTTLLALFALYIFGGEVIRGFVDALILGIGIGTYSSIFVAAPLLLLMNIKRGAVVHDDAPGDPEVI